MRTYTPAEAQAIMKKQRLARESAQAEYDAAMRTWREACAQRTKALATLNNTIADARLALGSARAKAKAAGLAIR